MNNQISCLIPILVSLFALGGCQTEQTTEKRKSAFMESIYKASDFEAQHKTDSAFYILQQAVLEFPDLPQAQAYALLEQARLYQKVCNFQESEKVLTEALQLDTKGKYSYYIHNLLGNTFQEQYLYKEALAHFDEALQATQDTLLQAITLNNKGVVLIEQERFQEAIEVLEPLLAQPWLYSQQVYEAKFKDNLGYAHWKNGNTVQSKNLLEEAAQLRDSIGDDYERIASLMHLARWYEAETPELSNQKALEAYETATRVASADDRLEALDLLIRNGEGENTQRHYEKYIQVKDSLERSRQTAKHQFAKIKYDAQRHQAEAQRQRTLKLFILIAFGLFIIGAVSVYAFIQKKNKLKMELQQQQVSYDTETRIAKKLHDELANEVYQTLSFVQTQPLEPHRERLVDALDILYDKTRNLSKEHSTIRTGADFEAEFKEMITAYQTPEVSLLFRNEVTEWHRVPAGVQVVWYRVVQEWLINMKKHSHATLILLNFTETKNEWKLGYTDNGVGFDIKKNRGGLQNVENRIFSVNGRLTFESEPGKGVKAALEIPKR
jgi:hypothetical protein